MICGDLMASFVSFCPFEFSCFSLECLLVNTAFITAIVLDRCIILNILNSSSRTNINPAKCTFNSAWHNNSPYLSSDFPSFPLGFKKQHYVSNTNGAFYVSGNDSAFISPCENTNPYLDDITVHTCTTYDLDYFGRRCLTSFTHIVHPFNLRD